MQRCYAFSRACVARARAFCVPAMRRLTKLTCACLRARMPACDVKHAYLLVPTRWLGAMSMVSADRLVAHGQPQVSDGAQCRSSSPGYVLRLEVTVSDARLACSGTDNRSLHMPQGLSGERTLEQDVNNLRVCFHVNGCVSAASS